MKNQDITNSIYYYPFDRYWKWYISYVQLQTRKRSNKCISSR